MNVCVYLSVKLYVCVWQVSRENAANVDVLLSKVLPQSLDNFTCHKSMCVCVCLRVCMFVCVYFCVCVCCKDYLIITTHIFKQDRVEGYCIVIVNRRRHETADCPH